MLRMWAEGTENGKPIVVTIIGLSHTNLDELRKGRPIKLNGVEAGLPEHVRLLIFSGKNEATMQAEIESLVGPNTKVSIDPRLKS